jgi:hypothetical protein
MNKNLNNSQKNPNLKPIKDMTMTKIVKGKVIFKDNEQSTQTKMIKSC